VFDKIRLSTLFSTLFLPAARPIKWRLQKTVPAGSIEKERDRMDLKKLLFGKRRLTAAPDNEKISLAANLRNYTMTMTAEEEKLRAEMWQQLKNDAQTIGVRLPCFKADIGYRADVGYYCVTAHAGRAELRHCEKDALDFRWAVLKKAVLDEVTPDDGEPDAMAWATAEFMGSGKRKQWREVGPNKKRNRLCAAYETALKHLALVFSGQKIRDLTEELTQKINEETPGPDMVFSVEQLKFVEKPAENAAEPIP